ncbi:MAG: hypothetical protein ACYC0X_24210 [Pirellulaceae bacterium]
MNDELIAFVRSWFDLLARGEVDKACALIDKPNSYGMRWTPETIIDLLFDCFGPGTVFASLHPEGPHFTAVFQTKGNARADVIPFSDGSGFSVEHDVPLNGEWSDLTAQFEFLGKSPEFEVILHDLHVL